MTIKLTRCILYKHGRNENINKIVVLTKKSHMSFIKYNFSPDYSRLPPGLLLPIETLLAIRMNLDMNMQTSYCLTGGGGGITPQGEGGGFSRLYSTGCLCPTPPDENIYYALHILQLYVKVYQIHLKIMNAAVYLKMFLENSPVLRAGPDTW